MAKASVMRGIPLDEAIQLGRRYAGEIERKGMPRVAQTMEALTMAATELEDLRKRCEAVEADAARWAWLRDNCGYSGSGPHNGAQVIVYYADAGDGRHGVAYTGPHQRVGIVSIDYAVDRAIAAAQEPSHG